MDINSNFCKFTSPLKKNPNFSMFQYSPQIIEDNYKNQFRVYHYKDKVDENESFCNMYQHNIQHQCDMCRSKSIIRSENESRISLSEPVIAKRKVQVFFFYKEFIRGKKNSLKSSGSNKNLSFSEIQQGKNEIQLIEILDLEIVKDIDIHTFISLAVNKINDSKNFEDYLSLQQAKFKLYVAKKSGKKSSNYPCKYSFY
ncbi:hypothetical protein PPERSA_04826 [Pseudocohnilembus persalinus]|uniref:Uncharacterized protein n=1 Tax=Pseudocohnilembus persalinus TaxID=266149 RepID=A0A0V0QJ80_PSEPJ|nr:hypothetical protein PPERSA_04826 [Pseudocohnilembus persalinus]|eukprot:KRX02204.1 hypothetical protein PPERSA_04826 [Pseudocohnilembus persalinus]